MLALDRKREILRLTELQGCVRVADLAQQFGVTEETIRRDLQQLAREGALRRTHGGAVSLRSTNYEAPLADRETRHLEAKVRMGAAAAALLVEGETCIMDASTTVLQMARQLPDMRLTVLTNSLKIATELALSRERVSVIGIGGTVRPVSLSFVGPQAERTLRNYRVDKAFLSCKGLDLNHGITDSNELEVELKKVMMEVAREVTILADASKLGYQAFAQIAPLDQVHRVITEENAPAEYVEVLREQGIEVVLV